MSKDYYDPERVIARRNERLQHFFELLFENTDHKFRLIGDKNCPAVIVNEKYCLSCFVKNFNLNFTDKPNQGVILETIKLQKDQQLDRSKVFSIIEQSQHRPVYKIAVRNTELYLAGYNFMNKKELEGKYPVFARFCPKIYFSQEYAQDIVDTYSDYDLDIC